MTIRLQHAERNKGREVMVFRDVDGEPPCGYFAVFEDGRSRVYAENVAVLANRLRDLGVSVDHIRVELTGSLALSHITSEELFDRLGRNETPAFFEPPLQSTRP